MLVRLSFDILLYVIFEKCSISGRSKFANFASFRGPNGKLREATTAKYFRKSIFKKGPNPISRLDQVRNQTQYLPADRVYRNCLQHSSQPSSKLQKAKADLTAVHSRSKIKAGCRCTWPKSKMVTRLALFLTNYSNQIVAGQKPERWTEFVITDSL